MKEFKNIHSIAEGHILLNLGKPKHPLISVINNSEVCFPTNLSNFRFVFDFYMITLKSSLQGSLHYGRNSYDYEDGTVLFTAPGQVITSGDIENKNVPENDGWTLVFHPDLIRKSSLGQVIDQYHFFSYNVMEGLHVSETERKTITDIVEKIRQEYSQNIDRHTQKLIISNIHLLLDYCTRYFDRQFYTRTNLNKDIVSRFEHLIKDYFNSPKNSELGIPKVEYFGRELNLSSHYLSDLLKKETGKNTLEQIHYYLIEKAKMNLLNSSDSISQIAYELGFEYPQHFSKLFKLKLGLSPTEFRNMN